MTQEMNREIKHYFRQIKLLFPIMGKGERKFLNDFRSSVEDFLEKNPGSNIADVIERFDSPDDVVHNYIASLDQYHLCKRINLRNIIKKILILIVILVAAIFTYRFYLLNDLYQQAQEHILSNVVQVIE